MADIINASQYNIYDKELEIAKKYMFPDPNNVSDYDMNFLRVGQMGYVTDVMAMSLKDALLYNMMTKSEAILYTAKTASAIYDWAKMYNVEIPMAKPSTITAQIYVNRSSIAENALPGSDAAFSSHPEWALLSNKKYVVLDRNTPFYTDTGIPFSLAKSLIFEVDESSDSVRCYEASSETPLFSYLEAVHTAPSIYNTVDSYSGDVFINIVSRLYQFETTKISKNITTNKISDIKVLSFDFSDNLCGFNAFYTGEGSTYQLQTYFNRLTDLSTGIKACYYNLTDENSIQLIFSGMPTAFRPKPNTVVYVEAYTTNGAAGNFDYNGQFSYTFRNSFANSDIAVNCNATPDASAVGGTNSPSLSEIKQKIISTISTKDVIITENDLNEYFANLSNASGRLTFIKKRDDLIRRIFTAYALLYYSESSYDNGKSIRRVAPTNTVDVIWDYASNNNSIKPYADLFSSDDNASFKIKKPMKVKRVSTPDGLFNYKCPFYLGFDIGNEDIVPFYINPYVNGYSRLNIDYASQFTSPDFENNIVPQNISITRSMNSASTSYNIVISSVSSLTADEINENLIVECALKDGSNTVIIESTPYDITHSESDELFQINLNLRINGDSSYFDVDSSGYNVVELLINGATYSLRENVSAEIKYKYKSGSSYNDLVMAKSIDNIQLFESLGNVMNSNVSKYSAYSEPYNTTEDSGASGFISLVTENELDTPIYKYASSGYTKAGTINDLVQSQEIAATSFTQVSTKENNAWYFYKSSNDYIHYKYLGGSGAHDSDDLYALNGVKDIAFELNETTNKLECLNTVDNNVYTISIGDTYYFKKASLFNFETVYLEVSSSYLIKSVPMIGATIADIYSEELSQQMTNYCKELVSNANKLETSTQMDLKLYNTYGYSVLSGETDGSSIEGQTNTTNISINLKILLNQGYNIVRNDNTDQQIRSFIQEYISSANDEGSFSLSTLIAALQIKFIDIIKSINYVNTIQDSYMQYVKINTYDPKDTTLVPEYLSIYQDENRTNNAYGLIITYIPTPTNNTL